MALTSDNTPGQCHGFWCSWDVRSHSINAQNIDLVTLEYSRCSTTRIAGMCKRYSALYPLRQKNGRLFQANFSHACSVPSYYLNLWWLFIRNKFHWNINQNTCIFIQGNAFENVVCKIASILCRPSELIILSQQRITSRFSSTPSCVGIHNVAWGSDAFILRGWVIEVVR